MTFEPTVFVVDDDPRARNSVCALVQSLGLEAQAFSSAEEFIDGYAPEQPGCLVSDVRMAGMSGLDLQDQLKERGIGIPIVLLTAYPRTSSTVRAIKAGAVTLLEKPYNDDELWDAIRKALAQDTAGRAESERHAEIQARAAKLTPSERAVMDLIVQGKPNKFIAAHLDLSLRTVENRRQGVFAKMGVASVAELVKLAIESKLSA
jgi:two-component system, LuxR family, response regulator FixJ